MNARGRGRGRGGRGGAAAPASALKPGATRLCTKFTIDGICRFGNGCHNGHILRNVGFLAGAHKDKINCCAIGLLVEPNRQVIEGYELYTGSQDRTVKKWTIRPKIEVAAKPNRKIGPVSALAELLPPDSFIDGDPSNVPLKFYDIKLDVSTPFEAPIKSLLLNDDCLFCGLGNGKIHGFHRPTGASFVLEGHRKEVVTMALVEHVLISGDFGGVLKFWTPHPGPPLTFQEHHSLDLKVQVACIKPVIEIIPLPQPEAVKLLWIGCVDRAVLLDLTTMVVKASHPLPDTPDLVLGMVPCDQNMLMGTSQGALHAFHKLGPHVGSIPNLTRGILTMAGCMTPEGPMLVCGGRKGWMNFIKLPDSQVVYDFLPHDHDIRALLVVEPAAPIGGSSKVDVPFLVTVSEDKSIALWAFSTSAVPRPK